jgi:hypothetical protein
MILGRHDSFAIRRPASACFATGCVLAHEIARHGFEQSVVERVAEVRERVAVLRFCLCGWEDDAVEGGFEEVGGPLRSSTWVSVYKYVWLSSE